LFHDGGCCPSYTSRAFAFAAPIVFAVFFVLPTLRSQSVHTATGSSRLQEDYNSALRFQASGDLQQAALRYRTFLANAQRELAAGYGSIGKYAKAVSLLDEAMALEPDAAELRLADARASLLMGDPSRAESLARSLLDRFHGDSAKLAQAHQLLGRALLKQNKDRDARAEMEKAVALDPSFANGYGLAVVCLDLDDESCASQVFHEMEQSFGDTAAIHMHFGRAYGNSDFVPQAIVEFRKAIAENPRLPGAHYSLAAALLSAGNDAKNVPEAEAELKKELAVSPRDFLTYAALGKLAVTYHRSAEAESYLKKAAAVDPANPDSYLYLGQLYFDTDRPALAEPELRKAIQLTTDPSRNAYQVQKAHFMLGRILRLQHRVEDAQTEMELAHDLADKRLAEDKDKLSGLLNNSEISGAGDSADRSTSPAMDQPENRDPQAMHDLKAFLDRLTPAIADSYNNLGAISASTTKYDDALKNFRLAAAWNPSLDGLDLNWGRAAFTASRFSEAIAPLNRYVRLHPADSGVRGALAISQFMAGDYSGCVENVKDHENEIASIPQMEYAYAESLVKTGAMAAGTSRLEAIEAAHPEIGDVHRSLGEVYASRQEPSKATDELRIAILLNAGDAQAHYDLGQIYLEAGNAPAAIGELETAIRISADDPAYHKELAAAYRLAARSEDAARELAIYERLKNSSTPPK
jgi:tetratricopeptide (TPR) repeat protein